MVAGPHRPTRRRRRRGGRRSGGGGGRRGHRRRNHAKVKLVCREALRQIADRAGNAGMIDCEESVVGIPAPEPRASGSAAPAGAAEARARPGEDIARGDDRRLEISVHKSKGKCYLRLRAIVGLFVLIVHCSRPSSRRMWSLRVLHGLRRAPNTQRCLIKAYHSSWYHIW